MINIQFISKSDLVNATRVGSQQTWSFIPSRFDPPTLVTDKVTRYSLRGTAKKTTILGEYEKGSIGLDFLDDAHYLFGREFYYSVRREEPFTVDTTAYANHGLGPTYRVFIPDNELTMPRFTECTGYQFDFNIRMISANSE